MHLILGGEANGKRQYVRSKLTEETVWLGEEQSLNLADAQHIPSHVTIVVCGLEQWLAKRLTEEQEAIEELLLFIQNRKVIIIVTDIGRGIVPVDATARTLRDACGRLNQQLVNAAESVTRIWFGIPQKLK